MLATIVYLNLSSAWKAEAAMDLRSTKLNARKEGALPSQQAQAHEEQALQHAVPLSGARVEHCGSFDATDMLPVRHTERLAPTHPEPVPALPLLCALVIRTNNRLFTFAVATKYPSSLAQRSVHVERPPRFPLPSSQIDVASLPRGLRVECVRFHPTKPIMAVGVVGFLAAIDLTTGARLCRIDVQAYPAAMAFSPDGSVLALATQVCWCQRW